MTVDVTFSQATTLSEKEKRAFESAVEGSVKEIISTSNRRFLMVSINNVEVRAFVQSVSYTSDKKKAEVQLMIEFRSDKNSNAAAVNDMSNEITASSNDKSFDGELEKQLKLESNFPTFSKADSSDAQSTLASAGAIDVLNSLPIDAIIGGAAIFVVIMLGLAFVFMKRAKAKRDRMESWDPNRESGFEVDNPMKSSKKKKKKKKRGGWGSDEVRGGGGEGREERSDNRILYHTDKQPLLVTLLIAR